MTARRRSTRPSARMSGYGVAHFASFYDLRHVLVLGRVTSGPGGDDIVGGAREVLDGRVPGAGPTDRVPRSGRARQTSRSGDCRREPARTLQASRHESISCATSPSSRVWFAKAGQFPLGGFSRPLAARRRVAMRRARSSSRRIPTMSASSAAWRCVCRREAGMRVVNVAVTQGSNKARQAVGSRS